MNSNDVYDFIAVGLGPFNLGLACLTKDLPNLNGIFIEQRSGFDWHPGMMIEGVTLQTPFMADLVTLAAPDHPLSFLNYLKEKGKLYSYYIRESFFIERDEYNQYCRWAIDQLDTIDFNTRVTEITYSEDSQTYKVKVKKKHSPETQELLAKKIVLGTGPSPVFPACVKDIDIHTCFHSGEYLKQKEITQQQESITVIGSGQSAAEIFYDLLQDIDQFDYQLNWITRSPRFFPLDYSKLTLEMTSPEYVDYFYGLDSETRDGLISNQKNLYKGINIELINSIFDLLYTKNLQHKQKVNLLTNCELKDLEKGKDTRLKFFHRELKKDFDWYTNSTIFATGYSYRIPRFLDTLKDHIRWDDKNRFAVHRNYAIDHRGTDIFVQNAELHTHGFVTPDLGMACYRNSILIKEITGIEHYPIEKSIAFQTFGVPEPQAHSVKDPVFQQNKQAIFRDGLSL